MKKIKRPFFEQGTVKIAKELLGKYLTHTVNGKKLTGKIVETEAYSGHNDPGSHAYRSKTPRNTIMFGKPGIAYVYFCYGNHYLFNIVTQDEGKAGAVLIRALEPVTGIGQMEISRKSTGINLTNGPGKLTQALGIDKRHTGVDVTKTKIFVVDPEIIERKVIKSGPRIGIKTGLDKMWRFWIKGNEYVSVK
jgi:DNA-3-methyladenine glycosylase